MKDGCGVTARLPAHVSRGDLFHDQFSVFAAAWTRPKSLEVAAPNVRDQGIDIAKRKGVYHGRQKKEVPDFYRHYLAYALHQTNKAQLAKDLGISCPVVDRLIREYEESHGGAAGALEAAQEEARE